MHMNGFEEAWREFAEKEERSQGVMTFREEEDFQHLLSYQAIAFMAGWAARETATISCSHCLYTDKLDYFIHAHGELVCSKNPGKYGTACPHCGKDQECVTQ